ncbi:DNA-3-methyladenine glycosylase [bacterium]|nr:DNA-3-methyladenine glycosylase [bacterium]
MPRLSREDYLKDAPALAAELIGCFLCRRLEDGSLLRLRITETEAYYGEEDSACHASKGRTKRTETLYFSGGHAYVYLCYGMHEMMNIVTGPADHPEAVLIRGIEGAEGPGRVTKRLNIDRGLNAEDLAVSEKIWVERGEGKPKIKTTPRIGIGYAKARDRKRKWRFTIALLGKEKSK